MTLHDRADIEQRLSICRHDVERLKAAVSQYERSVAIGGNDEAPHHLERARQSLQSAELRCAAVANELTQMGETV